MKILKYNSRRHSFKAKQRRTVLPSQSATCQRSSGNGGGRNAINTQARYIRAGYTPTAFIRNGIIGGGEGPGANGLYQIDDRIYTTTKMFLRDAYMYPRQPGQVIDPRYPYELHEFPKETGAAGLQLITTPKVHISGEYLASSSAAGTVDKSWKENHNNSSLNRRNVRKAAVEISLANEMYSMQKHRLNGESSWSRGSSMTRSVGDKEGKDKTYIHNELSFEKYDGNGRRTPHSTMSNRRKKKVRWYIKIYSNFFVPIRSHWFYSEQNKNFCY